MDFHFVQNCASVRWFSSFCEFFSWLITLLKYILRFMRMCVSLQVFFFYYLYSIPQIYSKFKQNSQLSHISIGLELESSINFRILLKTLLRQICLHNGNICIGWHNRASTKIVFLNVEARERKQCTLLQFAWNDLINLFLNLFFLRIRKRDIFR